jgi:prephenate dehydratase
VKIAYQGEPGAFSEAAARQVNAEAQMVPCKSFEDVFAAVTGGPANYGVLPIENSIGGSIHRNFDLMLEHEVPIVGELEVAVVHHLLALPGVALGQVKRVYSHPQALAQCDRFLRTLTGVEIIATYDTAGSAKMIADQNLTDAAAVASARAGEVFGLTPLKSSIQDYERNTTRFIIIGRRPLSDAKPDKTTIVFTLGNEAGALFKALSVFALRGIDLTKLESRPIPGRKWEYLFYADLSASREDLPCARALAHLAEFAPSLRILGSYPSYRPATDSPGVEPGHLEKAAT